MLTVNDVKRRIKEIKATKADYEKAHSLEDSLYFDVLSAIAQEQCEDAKECARLTCATQRIVFERYCS